MHNRPAILRTLFSPALTTLVLSALLAGLTGCISLKPASGEQEYYLLTAGPSNYPSRPAGPGRIVRLLPIEVPDYLQTRNMAVRTGSNEMIFPVSDQWAEPLDTGIRRVLAENLRAGPVIREVLTDEPPPANAKVYTILIHILSCEGNTANGSSSILFEAAWEISESEDSTPFAKGIFTAPPNRWRRGDYSDLADQISRAVQVLSRELNKAITNKEKAN